MINAKVSLNIRNSTFFPQMQKETESLVNCAWEHYRVMADKIEKLRVKFKTLDDNETDTVCTINKLTSDIEHWKVKIHNILLETMIEFN